MHRRWLTLLAGFCAAVCLAPGVATLGEAAQQGDVRSQIEQLLFNNEVPRAVEVFDASSDAARASHLDLLTKLAIGTLRDAAAQRSDRQAAVEACLSLLTFGPDRCERSLAAEPSGPATRLRLLSRRLPSDGARAQRQVLELTSEFTPEDWASVVEAAHDFPPAVAVPLLRQALAGGSDGVRFSAIDELSKLDDPAAIALLKEWSTRHGAPGQLVALGAVAGSGDPEALAAVKAMLPELNGRDLLAAAVALARQGDDRGRETLLYLLGAPEELLRLDAAAALVRAGVPAGTEHLTGALRETNPWLRLRALELWRGLAASISPGLLPPEAWRLLNDPMPWIRVRAAQFLLAVDAPTPPRPMP
jgi:HEAT repeat protein